MGDFSPHSYANIRRRRRHAILYLPFSLLVIINIDDLLLPVPSIDLALEQDVDLTVRAAFHLREMEVRRDETQEACSAPDVSALATD